VSLVGGSGSGISHFRGWSTGFPLLPEEEENTQGLARRRFRLGLSFFNLPLEVSAPIHFGPWNLISCNFDLN